MKKALTIISAAIFAITIHAQQYADAVHPDWKAEVPQPIYPDTELVSLYEKTWEIAAARVRKGPEGLPASPYLDENCYDDQLWIWDTCFMTLFSRYAPNAFPGKQTLLNLYVPLHDGRTTPLLIHMRDNPPLFAWAEWENFRLTADTAQADLVIRDKRYLQKHFNYFNNVEKGNIAPGVSPTYNPIFRNVFRDKSGNILGYSWTGRASGMDNTVRAIDPDIFRKASTESLKKITTANLHYGDSVLWIDAISQQALSALCIAKICNARGMTAEAKKWEKEYARIKKTVNDLYWDDEDGYYYDVDLATGKFCKVMTPASFWAMLAEIPDQEQAARMVSYLRDPDCMGGERPWTSLARNAPGFDETTGEYWRGGIWLPIVYMGTKALEKYGYTELADSLAESVVRQQLRTYRNFEPHTIWECYSPSADKPSTEYGNTARPDFCGWSALGPIALFIENIMGFRQADALTRTVTWDLKAANGTHGLKHLHFGDVTADIVYDAARQRITVTANRPFTLDIAGRKTYGIKAGTHHYRAKRLAQ